MRPLLFVAACILTLSTACEDPGPDPGPDPDPDTEAQLPTEATITLSPEGTPSPREITVAVDAVVTFDNSGSEQEAVIDFTTDLPSAPQDITVAAGSTGTVSPTGGGEWSYTNRSAGAGIPNAGTIFSEYDD